MTLYAYNEQYVFSSTILALLDPLETMLHPNTPSYLIPANSTATAPPEIPDGKQARWTGDEWVLEDKPIPPPTDAERLLSLEAENKLLKAQNQALADRGEFIEDVIAEMAMAIYP